MKSVERFAFALRRTGTANQVCNYHAVVLQYHCNGTERGNTASLQFRLAVVGRRSLFSVDISDGPAAFVRKSQLEG
jgi:hypothetical protein